MSLRVTQPVHFSWCHDPPCSSTNKYHVFSFLHTTIHAFSYFHLFSQYSCMDIKCMASPQVDQTISSQSRSSPQEKFDHRPLLPPHFTSEADKWKVESITFPAWQVSLLCVSAWEGYWQGRLGIVHLRHDEPLWTWDTKTAPTTLMFDSQVTRCNVITVSFSSIRRYFSYHCVLTFLNEEVNRFHHRQYVICEFKPATFRLWTLHNTTLLLQLMMTLGPTHTTTMQSSAPNVTYLTYHAWREEHDIHASLPTMIYAHTLECSRAALFGMAWQPSQIEFPLLVTLYKGVR